MPKFNLPNPNDITPEKVPEVLAKTIKTLQWFLNCIDDVNISDVDGSKIFANSIIWGKISNTRTTGTWGFTLAPGEEKFFTIDHIANLYKFAGPPMVRPQGSSSGYGFDILEVKYGYYDNLIVGMCAYYEEGKFGYYMRNDDTVERTGIMEWYRDGIIS